MKRFTKSLLLFAMLLVMTMIPAQSSMAASKYPGNVKKVYAKAASDTSVKLSWKKVSGATGYRVYMVNPATGSRKKVATTKSTSCVIKNIQVEQTYVFQAKAYRKAGKKTYWSKKYSPKVSIRTKMSTPGTIKKFRFVCNGNNSIFLGWNEASNTDLYIVYMKNETTGEYEKIGTTRDNSYQVKNLEEGKKYSFKVQPYHAVGKEERYGKLTDAVTATAKNVNLNAVHGRYWNATLKKNVTAKNSETGKKVTLKKGTKVVATKKGSSTFTVILKNDSKVKLKGSYLSYGNLYVAKKNYSKAQKEAFVNSRGYSSPTKYLVWVNQYTCNTTIFYGSKGAWKQVRSMPCVVGKAGHSPVGVYKLIKRSSAHGKPKLYYTWNTRMGKGNSFHCRIDKNYRAAESGGCVRLGNADLNYLAKKCALGTTVVSY